MIAIIDYQAGNQTSVHRALASLGVPSIITDDPLALRAAQGVIFPGVGAAGQAMARLKATGLAEEIVHLAKAQKPFLGICLGCQIMLERSQENEARTLGVFPGQTLKFDPQVKDEAGAPIRIPHMGWNEVRLTQKSTLWAGVDPKDQFYFVHSYYPAPAKDLVLGLTSHGLEFASFLGREGLWAVQFHPEKSGPPGLKILQNFYAYCQKVAHAQ
ncbi:MAG: imidazole glycerol phosphate synthase subunit HisH [Deltaproteobacteria bacterium]|jgi:glutamine amidotransferase|nr:imidazole glycerol phosphate synthase subunit HisH [Deltaproteobacteria bacterium]